jgi:hypothetical protein
MGKISSYPSDANVTTSDRLIGTDNENSNETKNFEIGDIINLASSIIIPQVGGSFVPYTGATNDVFLGLYEITATAGYFTSIYATNIFPTIGTSLIFIGGGVANGGVRIDTSANTYKFGDFDGNINATSIQILDNQQYIQFIGAFNLSNGQGTTGQVLTSAGAGVTPTWTSLPSLTGFVPYTGATGNVDLGGFGLTTSYLTSSLGILIDGNASAISLDGDEGNLGEVMISTGPSSTPVWADVNTLITGNLYKGNFYDSITQTLAAANTATPVILRNTDAPTTNGISIVTDGTNLSRITFANAGIYNILFSAQLANSGGTAQTVDFWLRKNGSTAAANIAHTNGKVQLQGNASFLMAAWNYFVDVAAGDYIQLVWAATSTNITMVAAAANGLHPETPSIIVTANIV